MRTLNLIHSLWLLPIFMILCFTIYIAKWPITFTLIIFGKCVHQISSIHYGYYRYLCTWITGLTVSTLYAFNIEWNILKRLIIKMYMYILPHLKDFFLIRIDIFLLAAISKCSTHWRFYYQPFQNLLDTDNDWICVFGKHSIF